MIDDRSAARVVPKSAITVSIDTPDLPLAYGVVSNISEAGACVWTTADVPVGGALVLRMTFPGQPQPLQAAGRVIWEDGARDARGALRLGLQWSHASGPQHARLKQLIAASA
jgi:hypothetical protein